MTPDPSVTALDFYQQVYHPLRLAGATSRNAMNFVWTIQDFGRFIGRELLLSDFTEDLMARFMLDCVQARKLSPVTANMRAKTIMSLWRLAIRKGYLPRNEQDSPDGVSFLKVPKRSPVAWTVPEMDALIKSSRFARGRFAGVPAGKWWPALLLVLLDTGLRRRAVFALRFDMLDWQSRLLHVPAELMKNNCDKYFRLHHQTIEALFETLPPKRTLMFPWPFSHQRSLYGRLKRILARAGLPHGKDCMFHRIRRTCATWIAKAVGEGLAIQQLGHSDSSCIKRYVDPRQTNRHDAADLLPRPAWDNPREIVVDVAPPPDVELGEPLHVRAADLVGAGDDVFARLLTVEKLTGKDLRDALDAAGIMHLDFAKQIGIGRSHLSRILNGRLNISVAMNEKIRVVLGLAAAREGRVGESERIVTGPKRWAGRTGAA